MQEDLERGEEGKRVFRPLEGFSRQDGGGFDPFEVLMGKMESSERDEWSEV